jgi:hypothetical protein
VREGDRQGVVDLIIPEMNVAALVLVNPLPRKDECVDGIEETDLDLASSVRFVCGEIKAAKAPPVDLFERPYRRVIASFVPAFRSHQPLRGSVSRFKQVWIELLHHFAPDAAGVISCS